MKAKPVKNFSSRVASMLTAVMILMLGVVGTAAPAKGFLVKTWDNFYKDQQDLILEFRYGGQSSYTLDFPITVSGDRGDFQVFWYDETYKDIDPDPGLVTNLASNESFALHTLAPTFVQSLQNSGSQSIYAVVKLVGEGASIDTIGQNDNPASWDQNLKAIHAWSGVGLTSIEDAFRGTTIEAVPGDLPTGVTDLSSLFIGRTNFNDPKVSLWDTSNITNMSETFYQASNFNQSLSGWDVSAVTDFSSMFYIATKFNNGEARGSSSAPLSWSINTNEPVFMVQTFLGASSFNQSLSSWNTSSVVAMREFLSGATDFNQDLSTFSFNALDEPDKDLNGVLKNTDLSCQQHETFIQKAADDGYVVQMLSDAGVPYFETKYDLTGCEKTWLNHYQFSDSLIVEFEVDTSSGLSIDVPLESVTSISYRLWDEDWALHGSGTALTSAATTSAANPTISLASNDPNLPATGSRVFLEISGTATTLGGRRGNPLSWSSQLRAIHAWSGIGLTGLNTSLIGSSVEKLPGDLPTGVTSLRQLLADQTTFNHADIGFWNTSNVTDMAFAFNNAPAFNKDISGWSVTNVTDLTSMFEGATAFNQDVSGWDTRNALSMKSMFKDATSFNKDLDYWFYWADPNVTNMQSMFEGATSFNKPLGNWVTSTVTDMSSMFKGATAFNADISEWTVSAVTDMSSMFEGATSFNQPIGGWNVGAVTDMSSMFKGATAFNGDISGWTVSALTNMSDMFNGATSFNQAVGGWDVTSVTAFDRVFKDAAAFNQGTWSWQPSATVTMTEVFDGAGMQCSSGDAFVVAIADHLPQSQAQDQLITGVFITNPNEDAVKAALEVIEQKGYSALPFAACATAAVAIANYSISAEVNELVSTTPTNTGGNAVAISSSPTLPTGLLLNINGGVAGRLSSPYSGTHTVTASNQHGDVTFTITISITNPPAPPPVQTGPPPAPVVQSVPTLSQSAVETTSGGSVQLNGQNLNLVQRVLINGISVTITSRTSSSLTISLPELDPGTYPLVMETSAGRISLSSFITISEDPATVTEQVTEVEERVSGLNPKSSWLNRSALAEISELITDKTQVTCVAYNDRPGVAPRKKALSRAMHACREARELGLETRVFVYGKAPQLADTVKIISR